MHKGDPGTGRAMPRPAMRVFAVYEAKWRSIKRRLHSRRSPPSVGRDANPKPAMHGSRAAKRRNLDLQIVYEISSYPCKSP